MLGLAVGDALGAALEWDHPEQIVARYGGPLRDRVASRTWSLGEWTDDTAMALKLAESMAERGVYDEDDVLARYLVWARSSPKDIGATVSHALARARTPDAARAAAADYHTRSGGHSAGNGSLMRTAPIAIRYRGDPGAIERISRLDSSLTHHDELAGDACALFNLTVAALLHDRRPPASSSQVGQAAADRGRGDGIAGGLLGGDDGAQLRAGGGGRRQPGRRRRHQRRHHGRAGRRSLRRRGDTGALAGAAARSRAHLGARAPPAPRVARGVSWARCRTPPTGTWPSSSCA